MLFSPVIFHMLVYFSVIVLITVHAAPPNQNAPLEGEVEYHVSAVVTDFGSSSVGSCSMNGWMLW